MTSADGRLAVVTGASTGIGYELAKCCLDAGYDVLACADGPAIGNAAAELSASGGTVRPVQAVHKGTKAFVISCAAALRPELQDKDVSVTCLMPEPTDTEFFARADMPDTKVGQDGKDDPAKVARIGFEAMEKGEGDVVAGWKNKLQAAMSRVAPTDRLAEMHLSLAAPRDGG